MRTYLCVTSVYGARSAVFARTGRVLSITCQATRNLIVLEGFDRHRNLLLPERKIGTRVHVLLVLHVHVAHSYENYKNIVVFPHTRRYIPLYYISKNTPPATQQITLNQAVQSISWNSLDGY